MATSLDTGGVNIGTTGYTTAVAWAWCNNETAGTLTNSYGVSSIDDDGTGLSELHLSVTQPNDDFACIIGSSRMKSDGDVNTKDSSESSDRVRSTTSVAFVTSYMNTSIAANQDAINFNIAIWGDD